MRALLALSSLSLALVPSLGHCQDASEPQQVTTKQDAPQQAPAAQDATKQARPKMVVTVQPFNYNDMGPMLDPVPTNPTVGSEVRRGDAAAVQCYSAVGSIDPSNAHGKVVGLEDCIRNARMINLASNARTPKPFELGLYYGTWSYLSGAMGIKGLEDRKGEVARAAQFYYYNYTAYRAVLKLTDEEVANSASVAVDCMIKRLAVWASYSNQTLVSK